MSLVRGGFFAPEREIDQQPTMFQPVAGSMRCRARSRRVYAAAFTTTRRDCDSQNARRSAHRLHQRARESMAIEAAYCICTIPLPVLRKIPATSAPRSPPR